MATASNSMEEPMEWATTDTRQSSNESNAYKKHKLQNEKGLSYWLFEREDCEKMQLYSSELTDLANMRKIRLEFVKVPYMKMCITVYDSSDEYTLKKIDRIDRSLEKDVVCGFIKIPYQKANDARGFVKSKEDCIYAKLFWDENLNTIRFYARSSGCFKTIETLITSELSLQNPMTSIRDIKTQSQANQVPGRENQQLFHYTSTFNNVNVHVYHCDILTVTTNVIVNAANEHLQHIGGVASAIAQQAGRSFLDECNTKALSNKPTVTEVVLTQAGNLPFKAVLHAIGPKWKDYRNKRICVDDLKYTIKNILKKAERIKFASIAIPSISAGIFGVPRDLCGEMYALAVHEFDKERPLYLKEIHFVDLDITMLGKIKAGFENLKSGILFHPIEKRYPSIPWNGFGSGKSYAASVNSGSSDSSRYKHENHKSSTVYGANLTSMVTPSSRSNFSPVKRIADETMAGIQITTFQFQNGLKVKIYTGSIVKFYGDAIIVSADEDISGFGALGVAVKAAGGFKYEKEFASMKQQAGTVCKAGDIFHCKGGNLTARHVMHIVLKQLYDTRQPQLTEYKQILIKASEKVNALGWRKVAMPLIGAGFVEKDLHDLQKCCVSLFEAVSSFCYHHGHSCHTDEIHFINKNIKVTSALIDTFKTNCSKPDSASKNKGLENQSKETKSVAAANNLRLSRSQSERFPDKQKTSDTRRDTYHSKSVRAPSSSSGGQYPKRSTKKWEEFGEREKESLRRTQSTPESQKVEINDFHEEDFFQSCVSKNDVPKQSGNLAIIGDSDNSEEESALCVICLCDITDGMKLECGHEFCKDCLKQSFKQHKAACPVCGKIYGSIKGNQPEDGRMKVQVDKYSSLPGYEGCGTITIKYYFPSGTQGHDHPNPGQPYEGTERRGFLPDNEEGQKVLRLLEKAFKRRLVFTIGYSRTTGKDNVVTWNDIHHKTKRDAGAQGFGYPDPTYLQRVQEELAAKGVTE